MLDKSDRLEQSVEVELESIETAKLLDILRKINGQACSDQLYRDVQRHYLPPGEDETRGSGRLWNPKEVRRAVYLYRLRKKGIEGALLRVLLFYRDGWGWEYVQPIFLSAFDKAIRLQASPIQRHLRENWISPKAIAFVADEYESEIGMKPQTAKSILGSLFFGHPAEGGSLRHLYHAVSPLLLPWPVPPKPRAVILSILTKFADELTDNLGMSAKDMRKVIEQADERLVEDAHIRLQEEFRYLRWVSRRHFSKQDEAPKSTNIKTLFGHFSKDDNKVDLRAASIRFTAVDILAPVFISVLITERLMQQILPPLYKILPEFPDDKDPLTGLQRLLEHEPQKFKQQLDQMYQWAEATAVTRKEKAMLWALRRFLRLIGFESAMEAEK